MQRIEQEANNQWRAVEVTVREGFVDPWQSTLGDYVPEDDCFEDMCGDEIQPAFEERDVDFYTDEHFPRDSRVGVYSFFAAVSKEMR
eukprot:1233770-Karenia_brevis.AAC.1